MKICLRAAVAVTLSAFLTTIALGSGVVTSKHWYGEWEDQSGGPVVVTADSYYWCCRVSQHYAVVTGFDINSGEDSSTPAPCVYKGTWSGETPPSSVMLGSECCPTIPDEVEGKPVQEIGTWAFYKTGINSLFMPSTITRIGEAAFFNCRNLVGLSLPDCLERISDKAFYGCEKLSQINIPASVTWMGSDAFTGCTNLKKVLVGWGETARVSNLMSEAGLNVDGVEFVEEGMSGNPWKVSPKGVLNYTAVAYVKDGVLHIEGNGPVESVPWADKNLNVTEVSIGSNITSLPENALRSISGLTTVNGMRLAVFNGVAAGVLLPASANAVMVRDGKAQIDVSVEYSPSLSEPVWNKAWSTTATIDAPGTMGFFRLKTSAD